MTLKRIFTLVAVAGLCASANATTFLDGASTSKNAFIDVDTAGSFSFTLFVTPTITNKLKLSFAATKGAFSDISYSFYKGSTLVEGIFLNKPNFNDNAVAFGTGQLLANDAYQLKISGTYSGIGVGQYKVAVTNGAVSAVPEPESYAMLLSGLGLMGAIARRRTLKK